MEEHTFGENLKFYRNAMGITQKQLGKLTSVGQGSIANYERGLRFPGESTLRKIAESLNVSLNRLLSVESQRPEVITGTEHNLTNFLDMLLNENIQKAWIYLENWKKVKEYSVLDAYAEILTPLLRQTGDLWFRGELGVAEEHLISSKIRELIALTADSAFITSGQPRSKRKLWMGLSAPGEEHDLALLMVSHLMKLEGWEVMFLGTGVPISDLQRMIKKYNPDILCISITLEKHMDGLEAYLEVLRNLSTHKPRIVIGGNVFPEEQLKKFPMITGIAGELEDSVKYAVQEKEQLP